MAEIPRMTWRSDGPDDAPVVVLGSSLGTSMRMWDPQVPALAQRFRVVRFELPGHGESTQAAPDPCVVADLADGVLGLLDHLGIVRFAYGGLSLGGMIGMQLASAHPDRVWSLVLLSTSAFLDAERWLDRIAVLAAEGMEPVADLVVPPFFTPAFVADQPEVVDGIRATVTSVDPTAYAACCRAIAAMDLRDQLGAIEAPTLVIAGAGDPATPPSYALEIATRVPDARLVVVDGAAHLANLEQPGAVTAAMVRHLRGDADAYEAGLAVRREVLGAEYVDAAVSAATPFRAPFDDFVTRSAWGMVWSRDGLDRRTRSCVTVAMLTALGRLDELALHVVAARRNGVTVDEIREVLLQAAVYCGAPAARSAFAVAERALVEAGDLPDV